MKNIHKKFGHILFVLAIISAGFIANAKAQLSAKAINSNQTVTRQFTKNSAANIKQILNRRPASAAAIVSEENRAQFNLGYAFVRVMYYASVSDKDSDAHSSAIVELVYLIERFENQPEAARLQKVLKSVVRRNGAGAARWSEIEQIADSYNARTEGEPRWFFDFGMTMTRLTLAAYFHDCDKIAKGLQKLQLLARIAPKSLPAEVLEPIKSLEAYAAQKSFNDNEFMTIDDTTGRLMKTVLA